jgi:hypothetical protein
MEVNGLQLPASFVQLIREGKMPGPGRGWRLKKERDAYGRPWEAYVFRFYEDEQTIARATAETAQDFADLTPEELQEANDDAAKEPGFIPFINDFSKILQFGEGGASESICFDYRENLKEPSVIYWADVYWRRVARNFEQFVGLWRPVDWAEPWRG